MAIFDNKTQEFLENNKDGVVFSIVTLFFLALLIGVLSGIKSASQEKQEAKARFEKSIDEELRSSNKVFETAFNKQVPAGEFMKFEFTNGKERWGHLIFADEEIIKIRLRRYHTVEIVTFRKADVSLEKIEHLK